jgi:D-glycero-D-manno-heptose 1,7-bisphosphate phosphatase
LKSLKQRIGEQTAHPSPASTYCYHNRVSIPSKDPQGQSNQPANLQTVFLERDGVINRKLPEGQYVTHWQHFDLLPGVSEAIARLNHAGLRVIVVTNQRGIALGLYTAEDVRAIHTQLLQELAASGAHIDGFYFCPHDKRECNCRKPLPGLFEQAQADFPEITPATSLIIGDSLSDIEFGQNLGLKTIFIEGSGENQKPGGQKAQELADQHFPTLPSAVSHLLT